MNRALGSLLITALAALAAGCGDQQAAARPEPVLRLHWHLSPGMLLKVHGDQRSTVTLWQDGGPGTGDPSHIVVDLSATVQQVDAEGDAQLQVEVTRAGGTTDGGIPVTAVGLVPYKAVVGPDGQILAGHIWPELGGAALVPGGDALSALIQQGPLPNHGSWATQVSRAYPTGQGIMSGQGRSSLAGHDDRRHTLTVRTTLTLPLRYDDPTLAGFRDSGSLRSTVESEFSTGDSSLLKTRDEAAYALDFSQGSGPPRQHQKGTATTTLTFLP